MSKVRNILNQIWSSFRRSGVADDLRIIEITASLLTEKMVPLDQLPRFRKPPGFFLDKEYQEAKLDEASKVTGDTGVLFDRHILFRLVQMLPGGRYPTPRHIVTFAQHLLELKPHHTLADFACGSGGFLVCRNGKPFSTQVTGCDISPEWARLAWANCALHGNPQAHIEVGNAISLCSEKGPFAEQSFDRILMNPPLGEAVDVDLARTVSDAATGTRSETVLTQLALNNLAPAGRAGILVPSGLLFSGSRAEKGLRQRLVDSHQLEALLSFPSDAFQPYSQLQTHLLCVRNQKPKEDALTWFFRAETDGYPTGKSRDLTLDPTQPSDLPLFESVFLSRHRGWDEVFPKQQPLLGIQRLTNAEDVLLGLAIGTTGESQLSAVEIHSQAPRGNLVLAAARKKDGRQIWVKLDLSAGQGKIIDDYRGLLQKIYGKKKVEEIPRLRLPLVVDKTRSVLLDLNARYLGIAIPVSAIREADYDLRPERYLKRIEEEKPSRAPATLLAEIRRNQKLVIAKIDGLLGRLEMPPAAGAEIPPPIWKDEESLLTPIGLLSPEQERVWANVCKKVESWKEGNREYLTPIHFTPDEVEPDGSPEVTPATKAALELFVKMGMVVLVSLVASETQEPIKCYRLVSDRDRWQPEEDFEPAAPEEAVS